MRSEHTRPVVRHVRTSGPARLIAALVLAVAAGPAAAAITPKAAVFYDGFDGNSLDTDKWASLTNAGSPILTVTGGTMTINSSTTDTRWLRSLGVFDYSPKPNAWLAEVSFTVNSDLTTSDARQVHLLTGVRNEAIQNFSVAGFDLRLVQGVDPGTFNLAWWGFNTNAGQGSMNTTPLVTGLTNGVNYVVTVFRKPDNFVDILLDGVLVSTQPLISNLNPSALVVGDTSGSMSMNVTFDYVGINLLPEPATATLLALAGVMVVRRRRRTA